MRVKGLQIAGALVAAGTVLAAWVLPRPRPEVAAEQPVAAVAALEPGSPAAAKPAGAEQGRAKAAKPKHASMERVETVLARKMPGVPRPERMRLARAILEEARFAALDPLFVVALIAVESGFDHGAQSGRGARGLMQLRYDTLEAEAERSKLEGDLDDPVTNVRAGVRYYRRLLAAFGTHDRALMAYNAGPNRILRYLREEQEIPERFHKYPRMVNAELSKLQRGMVPSGRGPVVVVPVLEQKPKTLPAPLDAPQDGTIEAQAKPPQPAA